MSLETRIEYIDSKESTHDIDSHLSFELHDLLSDDADWNNQYWEFEPTKISLFVKEIRKYYEASKKGIVFSAIWSPDKAVSIFEVTISELENKFYSNSVGTKAMYVVRKNS